MRCLIFILCLLLFCCKKERQNNTICHKEWASEYASPPVYIVHNDEILTRRNKNHDSGLQPDEIKKALLLLDKSYHKIVMEFYQTERVKPFNQDKYFKQIWKIEDDKGKKLIVINMFAYTIRSSDSFGNVFIKNPNKHVIILNDMKIYNFFIQVNLSENNCSLISKDSHYFPSAIE